MWENDNRHFFLLDSWLMAAGLSPTRMMKEIISSLLYLLTSRSGFLHSSIQHTPHKILPHSLLLYGRQGKPDMVFLTPVNGGQGRDHNQRGITLRKSLAKHSSKWVTPGGSQTFALALKIALFSFANDTLWAVQNPPFHSKSSSQAGSFLLPLPPPQGSDGFWHSPSCSSLSSIFERNSRWGKKSYGGKEYFLALSVK